jgi:hypothetical protein
MRESSLEVLIVDGREKNTKMEFTLGVKLLTEFISLGTGTRREFM